MTDEEKLGYNLILSAITLKRNRDLIQKINNELTLQETCGVSNIILWALTNVRYREENRCIK